MSFGHRLPIDQAVQTYPNLPIHRSRSICYHVIDDQMSFKTHDFSSTSPWGYTDHYEWL